MSHLNIVLIIAFVLVVVSVGFAEWKKLDDSNKLENVSDTSIEPKITNNQRIPKVDISDWKTFHHDDFDLEVKYPPYYYAVSTTQPGPLWRTWKTPVFSLILNEVPPGGGVKDAAYPNISINVFRQLTTTNFLALLRKEYGEVHQKEFTVGVHKAVLLDWIQGEWNNEPIINKAIFIETPKFLYVVIGGEFDPVSTQNILYQILLNMKL